MAYGDFKELAKITASEKVLRDKAFNIAKNPKCDGYQRSLAAMGYKFFHRKSASLVDNLMQVVLIRMKIMSVL